MKEMSETKKQYVIYLQAMRSFGARNDYGYYSGNLYTVQGDRYPLCIGNQITPGTRRYSSYGRALTSAIKIREKCPHVVEFRIDEVEDLA